MQFWKYLLGFKSYNCHILRCGFHLATVHKMALPSAFSTARNINSVTPEFLKYEEAIRKLNGLQTNFSVLQDASKRIQSGNSRSDNVRLTLKYLERLGISIDSINDRIIHVSGTKGKGSTAMLTESLLRSVPYKTGLFVSPHITSVRERIAINGKPLTLTTFVDYFWEVYNPLSQQKEHEHDMPSYFKFLTIMALKVFIAESVDVAIIEVGIGGELDCTNVLRNTPVVGITSIGLDHTSILGDTVEKIAWEKAGILKPGSRAFTLPDHKESVLQVIQSRAAERKSQLEIVPSLSEYNCDFTKLSLPKKLNVSLALQLAKAWDSWNNNKEHKEYNRLDISEREQKAVNECQILGRCQIINWELTNTTYYLDGAHTVESIKVAKKWFEENCPREHKKILIFNVTGNRSARALLEVLKDTPFSEAIFCTNDVSNTPEQLPVDFIKVTHSSEKELGKAKDNLGIWLSLEPGLKGHAVPTVAEALTLAQGSPLPVSVLVTGSLHLVGAALSLLNPS